MKEKLNMVLVGDVCIDQNRLQGVDQARTWGSAVLYMANYASEHFDVSSLVMASYGDDFLQVKPQNIQLLPGMPNDDHTLLYQNIVDNNARIQYCFGHETTNLPVIEKDTLAVADILVFAPLRPSYPVSFVEQVLRATNPSALTVLCPQGYFRRFDTNGMVHERHFDEARAIVPLFDLAFLSDQDPPRTPIAPDILVQNWSATAKDTHIIMTHAQDGASLATPDGLVNIPAIAIPSSEIVDSVGAGDTFAIATTLSYFLHHDVLRAIEFGHKAAHDKLLRSENAPVLF